MSEQPGLEIIRRDGSVEHLEDHDEQLEVLRHSTSHLMALAVMDLFPDVHLGIGPATSEGERDRGLRRLVRRRPGLSPRRVP